MKTETFIFNLSRKATLLLVVFFIACFNKTTSQSVHPHILVKQEDKQTILDKIDKHEWAKKVFDKMVKHVTPYVERHKTDREWILSRYLMNRAPGKRYTQFFSDEDGTALTGYAGDAPVPTVRVSPHKRPPTTKDGYGYKTPTLEEVVPYDTSMQMYLQSTAPGGKKEWTQPGTFVEKINGTINQLALDAAIVYWLTGKEEYAKFAADILNQWAQGASYQNPIEGACRTGFLSIQTLGDGNYEPMPLAYDFVYDYMRKNKYERKWYEIVFDKIAHTMTFRGLTNNNWFAAETPALVFAALSLENKNKRDYYLDYFLNKDTVNNSCGTLALPSAINKWLTPDGHWKELGGYHTFPVSSLLVSALAMENNGYKLFNKHPALLQSSYVMLKYSFPNFSAPNIGDTGPVSQSPECLEIGLLMAKKYGDKIAEQLTAAMDVIIKDKGYKRETADYLGLLTYLPEIPATKTTYTWPRSGELEFARCYIQRNGTDKETGLMYLVQGATYNHNHANGMSLELYGAGRIMGIDPGKGITYEAPMHVNYYAQWAAHNTVVAGGVSSSVPYFTGGGGTKKMGQIELVAMEPKADKEAISPYCSFTDTRYTDISTNTKQHRTLALIRTSSTSGYYVDVYRSAHPKSNEYVYHNIGNDVQLLDENRKSLQLKATEFPISKEPFDPPGFRLIKDYKTTGKIYKNVIALFNLKEAGDDKHMQVSFTGGEFYTGKGPQSGTADIPYRTMPTPTIINRREGEAWNNPFIAVYEPFNGANKHTIERIENIYGLQPGESTGIKVFNRDGSQQIILQTVNGGRLRDKTTRNFVGKFGVISTDKKGLKYLYLGEGSELSYNQYSLLTNMPKGAANLEVNGNTLIVSCNQPTTLKINGISTKAQALIVAANKKNFPIKRTNIGLSISVPAVKNAVIQLQ